MRKAPFTAYPTFCISNAVADNHCYLRHVDLRLTCVESLIKGYKQFEIDILSVTRFNYYAFCHFDIWKVSPYKWKLGNSKRMNPQLKASFSASPIPVYKTIQPCCSTAVSQRGCIVLFLPIVHCLWKKLYLKYVRPENMTHSQMFQKVEYGWGPIFKVVLEC